MKKLIVLFLCLAFASSAFAVDYVGVNSGSKRGKFSKTSDPVFASVTATTQNYIVSGDIRVTSLYVTTNATIPALTYTTASGTTSSVTNLMLLSPTAAATATSVTSYNVTFEIKDNAGRIYLIPSVLK